MVLWARGRGCAELSAYNHILKHRDFGEEWVLRGCVGQEFQQRVSCQIRNQEGSSCDVITLSVMPLKTNLLLLMLSEDEAKEKAPKWKRGNVCEVQKCVWLPVWNNIESTVATRGGCVGLYLWVYQIRLKYLPGDKRWSQACQQALPVSCDSCSLEMLSADQKLTFASC